MPPAITVPSLVREHNLGFALEHLPHAPTRVLEVGCGDGELARDLGARGYEVTALDPAPEAVAKARDRGVHVVAADLLAYEDEPFEAVLFTRSLHHIVPLDAALARAEALLASGGTLVLDEFAVEQMDETSAAWFYGQCDALAAAGISLPGHEAGGEGPRERWLLAHRHDPPLSSGQEMRRAFEERFDVGLCEEVAYLYRYFYAWLDGILPAADAVTRVIHRTEESLIHGGAVRPLGLRLVGRRPAHGAG